MTTNLAPMTIKLILCVLVISVQGAARSKRRIDAKSTPSAIFGQIGAAVDDDSQFAGLTDSIQGLFKPMAESKPTTRTPLAVSKKKGMSSKSKVVPSSKSNEETGEQIAERAEKAAAVLARTAGQAAKSKVSKKTKSSVTAAPPKSKISTRIKTSTAAPHEKLVEQQAPVVKSQTSHPKKKGLAKKYRPAKSASPPKKSPSSSVAADMKKHIDKVTAVANKKKVSPKSTPATAQKRVTKEVTTVTPKPTAVAAKSSNSAMNSTSSTKNSSKPEIAPNMSSIAEGAKDSPLSTKKEAVGTFTVDPSSNPLAHNTSNRTRNSSTPQQDLVIEHELPMASLAFDDDDDKKEKKNISANGTSVEVVDSVTTSMAQVATTTVAQAATTTLAPADTTTMAPAATHESVVKMHNDTAWQMREQYLESQIAELKRELKQKQGESATSAAAPQKQEVSTSKSAAIASTAAPQKQEATTSKSAAEATTSKSAAIAAETSKEVQVSMAPSSTAAPQKEEVTTSKSAEIAAETSKEVQVTMAPSSTAAPQKQEAVVSKSAETTANASSKSAYMQTDDDSSDSSTAPAPVAPATLFLGERHGLRFLHQRPFAFGSLNQAPEVDKSSLSSGWMSWLFTSQHEAAQAAVKPPRPRSSANKVSLLAVHKGRRQDWERTEIAALKEGRQAIFLGDSFGTLENQDITQERRLQQEDKLARVHARSEKVPLAVTKKALEERRKTDVSGFWGTLENEDRTIQHSLNENGDDLDDYLRLTKEQNDRVSRATAALAQDNLNLRFNLKRNDQSFEATTIHDEFQNYEQHDKKTIGEIKADPDLQMLQLQHKHHEHA